MTQEALRDKVKYTGWYDHVEIESEEENAERILDHIMQLINQHVAEVIGEDNQRVIDEAGDIQDGHASQTVRLLNGIENSLRAEQRERAGLEK